MLLCGTEPTPVFAQGYNALEPSLLTTLKINGADMDLGAFLYAAYTWLFRLAGLAAVLRLIYAGLLYVFGGLGGLGGVIPDNISSAKKIFTELEIGGGILLLSYLALYTINPKLVNFEFKDRFTHICKISPTACQPWSGYTNPSDLAFGTAAGDQDVLNAAAENNNRNNIWRTSGLNSAHPLCKTGEDPATTGCTDLSGVSNETLAQLKLIEADNGNLLGRVGSSWGRTAPKVVIDSARRDAEGNLVSVRLQRDQAFVDYLNSEGEAGEKGSYVIERTVRAGDWTGDFWNNFYESAGGGTTAVVRTTFFDKGTYIEAVNQ
ncbi:MAG: hypothetical protein A2542_00830 [Parcubacteria group bacterium RIFOXYD2_FULL_52_8]|nr:MAG: hypothetical protein A2542_00830 [Parcubacteria group bacterium RIFOXYD2_FULL_52_8]